MLIEDVGSKIETRDITALEAELGAVLLDSYREFLLLYNGGVPTPDIVDVSGLPGTPTDVQVFFGIARQVESSDLSRNISLLGSTGRKQRRRRSCRQEMGHGSRPP
jgi:hypothetical protein